MHALKGQQHIAQGKRSDTLGYKIAIALTPCKGKSILYRIKIRLLPLQGVTNERALTQGVASLALLGAIALCYALSAAPQQFNQA